jgi:hypothetical protein
MKLMTPFLTTITACAWMTVPCSRYWQDTAQSAPAILLQQPSKCGMAMREFPRRIEDADSVRTIQDINADGYDKAVYYANLQSHAGLIDIFTSRLRQLEREKTAPER